MVSVSTIQSFVKASGVKSILQTKPIKIEGQIQSLIYKPKYDLEFNKLLDSFDKGIPLAFKKAVTKQKLADEMKAWGRVLNHDIKNDGLSSVGINPINMDSEITFANLLNQRNRGNYGELFIGQGEFTGNVVVNNYLRTGKTTHKDWTLNKIQEVIDSAHATMGKIKLPHDTVLYRCVRTSDHIPNVGETFVEKGFLSTSINRFSAGKYGGQLLKIYASKGTSCIPNPIDFEILLKDHSKFKVLSNDGFCCELLLL